MKYFIDTEFVFDAKKNRVIPLSLALVREDGNYFYAVCIEAQTLPRKSVKTFVQHQVLPVLFAMPAHPGIKSFLPNAGPFRRRELQVRLRDWIGGDTPEFWGDYSALDYVVLSTLMGGFKAWPEGWPMYVNDFQQAGMQALPSTVPHNALADALALKLTWGQQEGGEA